MFILSLNISLGQIPSWEWAKSDSGITSYDSGMSCATDGSGNVYVTGSFSSPSGFGTYILTSTGANDIFTVKYDPNGNVLWAKSAGGTDSDNGFSIVADGSSNVYVTGWYVSPTITFDTITLFNESTFPGTADFFIVKYDSNGNVVWATSCGGTSSDEAQSISADGDGNVYIIGSFISDSITLGSYVLLNSGSYDLFIAKFDSSGNILWATSEGGTGAEYGYGISLDMNGNIFITGWFSSLSLTFGSFTLINTGNYNFFIVKYAPSGNILWASCAIPPIGIAYIRGQNCVADFGGNVYVLGFFNSSYITIDSTILTNAGYHDVFVVKYDPNGNVLWAKSLGGIGYELGYGITTDNSSNVYLAGVFNSPAMVIDSVILINTTGNDDIFLTKYDSTGNVIWATSIGGIDQDCVQSCATDSNGNLCVTGWYNSPSITFGSSTLNNSDIRDIFTAKLGMVTGIEENNLAVPIKIYPNPSSNTVTFQLPASHLAKLPVTLIFFNSMGQQVVEQVVSNSPFTISVEGFSSGIYGYQVRDMQSTISYGKLVVE